MIRFDQSKSLLSGAVEHKSASMSTDSLVPSATPARDAAMPQHSGGALRVVVGILILAVVINVLFPLLLQRTDAARALAHWRRHRQRERRAGRAAGRREFARRHAG